MRVARAHAAKLMRACKSLREGARRWWPATLQHLALVLVELVKFKKSDGGEIALYCFVSKVVLALLRFGVSFWFSIGVSLRGSRSSLFWIFIWVSCGYLLVSTGYFHGLS